MNIYYTLEIDNQPRITFDTTAELDKFVKNSIVYNVGISIRAYVDDNMVFFMAKTDTDIDDLLTLAELTVEKAIENENL